MIKRHYFFMARKYSEDGTERYQHSIRLKSHRSWCPQPQQVFEDMKAECEESLKDKPGSWLAVISFSRV